MFILEGEKVLVSGNFLTLFDVDLNQLKQVPLQDSNDRYFITTFTRERYGWKERTDGADNFLICVWPDMRKALNDYSPTEENVPQRYVGKGGNTKAWIVSSSLD